MRDARSSKRSCASVASNPQLGAALLVLACAAPLAAQDEGALERAPRHTDTRFSVAAPSDAEAWRARAAALRARVRWAAGLLPELPRPLVHAESIPRWEDARCRVSSVRFESAPGLFVYGNLYESLDDSRPRPIVLSPHGHWGGGRFESSAACSVPARCVALARAGAVVFAYDMLGFGDSKRQLGHREALLESADAERYGLTSFALQTWNSIRALDYVLQLPAIDTSRVAITGASGGGTQSFVLACIDPRVAVSVPVNMVSFTMQGGCSCENAPGLRWDACNPELAATFAPKPQLLVSASGDWTRETPQREFPYLRSVYALLDAADAVENAHFDSGHNYDAATRRAVYAFLDRRLFTDGVTRSFEELPLPPEDLLPFHAQTPVRSEPPPFEHTWERLRAAVEARATELAPRDAVSLRRLRRIVHEALEHAAGSPLPQRAAIEHRRESEGEIEELIRDGRALRFRRTGSGARLVLLADPRGLDAPAPEHLEGSTLIRLELRSARGTREHSSAAERERTRFSSTFQRSSSCAVLEGLTTALVWFGTDPAGGALTLVARGEIGALALAALARIDPAQARTIEANLELRAPAVELPNVERVGGLSALLAVQSAALVRVDGTQHLRAPVWARTAAALERRRLRLEGTSSR